MPSGARGPHFTNHLITDYCEGLISLYNEQHKIVFILGSVHKRQILVHSFTCEARRRVTRVPTIRGYHIPAVGQPYCRTMAQCTRTFVLEQANKLNLNPYPSFYGLSKAEWKIYVPPVLTLENSAFYPRSVSVSPVRYGLYLCSVRFSQHTATVSPHSINRFGSVVET
jgi:hypothetical protein